MSVLLTDSENSLMNQGLQVDIPDYVLNFDILDADDTVLIGRDTKQVQILLNTIEQCGYTYGLEMN